MLRIHDEMLDAIRSMRDVLVAIERRDADLGRQLRRAASSVVLNTTAAAFASACGCMTITASSTDVAGASDRRSAALCQPAVAGWASPDGYRRSRFRDRVREHGGDFRLILSRSFRQPTLRNPASA
jgi:hypothetical protein